MSTQTKTVKMAFVVGSTDAKGTENMNIVDLLGVKRICPGYFIIKVDENNTSIPHEAGEAITEENIEKLLAHHYLWYKF